MEKIYRISGTKLVMARDRVRYKIERLNKSTDIRDITETVKALNIIEKAFASSEFAFRAADMELLKEIGDI